MASGAATIRRLWKRPGVRAAVWQGLVAAALLALCVFVIANLRANLPRMKLELGFDFLLGAAGFEIGDNLIGYRAGDTILAAFVAGLANTIQVAAIAIVLTTVLGTLVALARLSSNLILARGAWLYVETVRNIPLLLQLYFWHLLIVKLLPAPRLAWNPLPHVFLSNRGLAYPVPVHQPIFAWLAVAAIAGGICAWIAARISAKREPLRRATPPWAWALAAATVLPLALLLVAGQPVAWDVPQLRGFNFQGGGNRVPEFAILIFGLVTYQAGFAAESIRAGIQGVARGQVEAAQSLGLSRRRTMRLVVLPQALRIVVPPLTSQYLSLTKNSSLAVAIGYPDLVRVSMVVTGDTGRAVECVTIMLAVYLALSLATAAFMNWYNRRIALETRA